MAATDSTMKDKKMASTLKRRGDERTSGRCPICNRTISLRPHASNSRGLYNHIAVHS